MLSAFTRTQIPFASVVANYCVHMPEEHRPIRSIYLQELWFRSCIFGASFPHKCPFYWRFSGPEIRLRLLKNRTGTQMRSPPPVP